MCQFPFSVVLFLTSYIHSQVYWLCIDYLVVAKSAVVSIEVSLLSCYLCCVLYFGALFTSLAFI